MVRTPLLLLVALSLTGCAQVIAGVLLASSSGGVNVDSDGSQRPSGASPLTLITGDGQYCTFLPATGTGVEVRPFLTSTR